MTLTTKTQALDSSTGATAERQLGRPSAVHCSGPKSETVTRQLTPVVQAVLRSGAIVGFIETVGPVFVTLAGPHYHQAVEIGQSLDAAVALALLAPRD